MSTKKVTANILEIVDNQLRDNTPPATRNTLERLKREGHSHQEARQLIGQCVAVEIDLVMKQMEPFNEARFVKMLNQLPTAPRP